MFRETIATQGDIHKNHQNVYEHTGVVVDLNYLKEISDTPESQKALDVFLKSCEDYYESIKKLSTYIDDHKNDPEHDSRTQELALEQSKYHDIVEIKLEDFILELASENKDISWSSGIRNNRQEIGRFAALVGEGE